MSHCRPTPSHNSIRAANSCGSLSSCRSTSHRTARQASPLRIHCWACPQQGQSALPSPHRQGASFMRLPCTIRQAPCRSPLHQVPVESSCATTTARALGCWPPPQPWHLCAGKQEMLPEAASASADAVLFLPLALMGSGSSLKAAMQLRQWADVAWACSSWLHFALVRQLFHMQARQRVQRQLCDGSPCGSR